MFELGKEINDLSKSYIKGVRRKAKKLKFLAQEIKDKNDEVISAIEKEAHRLKGSGKSYGFHAISHLGERIESECIRLKDGSNDSMLDGQFNGNMQKPLFQMKRNIEELCAFCEQAENEFEGKYSYEIDTNS